MNSSEKIFITGATGMLGAHLVAELLCRGEERVVVSTREGSCLTLLHQILIQEGVEHLFDKITFVTCDITNYTQMTQLLHEVDIVYNCAAKVSFLSSESQQMIRDNVNIVASMTEAALTVGVKRFIHVSSIAALGNACAPEIITETSESGSLSSRSAYGASKFFSEMELWRRAERGLSCVAVNPGVIIGYGDASAGGSAKIFDLAQRGMPFFSDGTTGYVGVHDVVKAMIALSESTVTGERFILSAESISVGYLLKMIYKGFGKEYKGIRLSPLILKFSARILTVINSLGIKSSILSATFINNLLEKHIYNGSKIKELIPNFNYTPLQEEIDAVCRNIKSRSAKK